MLPLFRFFITLQSMFACLYSVFKVRMTSRLDALTDFHQSSEAVTLSNNFSSLMKIIFIKMSGSHLLSHAVARIVPSAVKVLTVVFGMGTGVSPSRIATGQFYQSIAQKKTETFGEELALRKTDSVFFCGLDPQCPRTNISRSTKYFEISCNFSIPLTIK